MPNGDVTRPGTGGIKLNDGVISVVDDFKASLISNASVLAEDSIKKALRDWDEKKAKRKHNNPPA